MRRLLVGQLALAMMVSLGVGSAQGQGPKLPVPGADEAPPPENAMAATLAREQARVDEWVTKSAEFEKAWRDAPAEVIKVDKQIAALEQQPPPEPPSADQSGFAHQLLLAEQQLSLAKRKVEELDDEAGRRAERRKKVPEFLRAARRRLSELDRPGSKSAAEGGAVSVRLRELRRQALAKEIEAYENELGSYETRGILLMKRRDLAELRVTRIEVQVEALREADKAEQLKQMERDREENKALMQRVSQLPTGVRDIATQLVKDNAAIASQWTGQDGVVDKIDAVSQKLERAEQRVASVDAELDSLTQKVEAVGLADSLGTLLRQKRADAPNVGMYRRFIRMRKKLIGTVQLEQIQLREQRQDLHDIEGLVEHAMREVDEPLTREQRISTQALLKQLFETKRDLTDRLLADYETYFQKLIDFDAMQQELVEQTQKLTDFIDERILWIPSSVQLRGRFLNDSFDALEWLLRPRYLSQLVKTLKEVATHRVLLNLLVVFLVLVRLVGGKRARDLLHDLGEQARSDRCKEFVPTGKALALSLMMIPWLPGLVVFLGWRLGGSPAATQYVRAIGHGLLVSGFLWMTLRFCREMCRPNGITDAHCHWPAEAVASLRKHLTWFTAIVVPAAFIVFVFESRGEPLWQESVGRATFVVGMLATVVFTHLMLRRDGSLDQGCSPAQRRSHSGVDNADGSHRRRRDPGDSYGRCPRRLLLDLASFGQAAAPHVVSSVRAAARLFVGGAVVHDGAAPRGRGLYRQA